MQVISILFNKRLVFLFAFPTDPYQRTGDRQACSNKAGNEG